MDSQEIYQQLALVAKSSRKLIKISDQEIATILEELATLTLVETDFLLQENKKDLQRMDPENPKYDRLQLTPARLKDIADDLRKVALLPSPLHQTLEKRTLPNGLEISRVSVPLGVIGIVYESRPNVTFDVFALCLRSGNATVLKGSRDAHYSNLAIIQLIHQVLDNHGIKGVCYLAPSDREALLPILQADNFINTVIPRGGQGLINFVRENSKIPVIETGAGIVHTYFDETADLEKGKAVICNAKARRVSVCNALDCLVIHQSRLSDLPELLGELIDIHKVTVFADDRSFAAMNGHFSAPSLQKAAVDSFGTEFLSLKMSVKTVDDLEEAMDHIAQYSSKHSEAIISENQETVDYFLMNTDAAVVYANTSTAFTDGGQFGLGAEIGISTQKLHARGPMGLQALTSYKWIVKGSGQIRS